MSDVEYRSLNPDGKAMLKAAAYLPPHEMPDQDYPFQLTTGRTIYHFHTRTKTGRAPELNGAAPDVWVELSAADCANLGIDEGDLVEVRTARVAVEARVRISGIRSGVAFLPFHYGYWDTTGAGPGAGPGRAANELTPTDWDPVSKQPLFKTAAAAIHRVDRAPGVSPAPALGGSAAAEPITRDTSQQQATPAERTTNV